MGPLFSDHNDSHSERCSTEATMSEREISDDARTGSTGLTEIEIDDEDQGGNAHDYHHTSARGSYRFGQQISDDLYTLQMTASDAASSTRSLWAEDLDYRQIHGRRYCGEYFMPNDEIELLRMTLLHHIIAAAMDEEITLAPLSNPSHVLDVGTGTGEWAIRLAELFPECEVVGTDIAATAETQGVPVNVFFEIEDAEDWDRPRDHYDLVHFRMMKGAFKDWGYIYDRAYESIKPGGWIEVLDFNEVLGSFLEELPVDERIQALFQDLRAAADQAGRPMTLAHLEPSMLMDAGFVDVVSTEHVIPVNNPGQANRQLWFMVIVDFVEAAFLRLLTEYRGWDPEECKAACDAAATEIARMLRDPGAIGCVSVRMQVLVGRKPFNAPDEAS